METDTPPNVNQTALGKRVAQQNRWLRIPLLGLACGLMMLTGLLRPSNGKLALQLGIGLAIAVVWFLTWVRGSRFENRFEMLMWTGVLLGTVCDVLAFKPGYYLFGVVALVGFIGWQGLTPSRKRPEDAASGEQA